MARLHEFQGKPLLARAGIPVPRGGVARSADEAAQVAKSLAGPVVVKIQAWTTGRAAIGGVAFAKTPQEASDHARRMLAMKVGNFPVTEVLVEEQIKIARELFVSLSIDDRERCPVILLSLRGGTGIEEHAGQVKKLPCDVAAGPNRAELESFLQSSDIPAEHRAKIADAVVAVFAVARANEARSVEINPLVITADGKIMAADCRITIDDYAFFRHPELGIDIARELDHPPTELERIAYAVEQADHRGTFFFAQMNLQGGSVFPKPTSSGPETPIPSSKGLIGFHGAGGGGSMMSMDAITNEGFTIANFCDTSGNPSPAKVYRAARIILSQPGLIGYFGSGSGVANQEQFWSAYGLAKAFIEMNLDIPAVIRLGGNTEDRAVEILQSACKAAGIPAIVEAYRKTDAPAKIAARFAELVSATDRGPARSVSSSPPQSHAWQPRSPRRPGFVGAPSSITFTLKGGKVWIDPAAWKSNAAAIISRSNGLLRDSAGKPALSLSAEEFAAKDSDMIACEIECLRDGISGVFVELEIPGLDTLVPSR